MNALVAKPTQLSLNFWTEVRADARELGEAQRMARESEKVTAPAALGHPLQRGTAGYRRTDPETSAEAARELVVSGALNAQQEEVLAAVRRWPGRTSAELAVLMKTNRQMPARRLPELYVMGMVVDGEGNVVQPGKIDRGEVKKCKVCGRRCVTWWPNDL